MLLRVFCFLQISKSEKNPPIIKIQNQKSIEFCFPRSIQHALYNTTSLIVQPKKNTMMYISLPTFVLSIISLTAVRAIPQLVIEPSDSKTTFNMNYTFLKDFGGEGRNGYLAVFDAGVQHFHVYPPGGHNCSVGVTKTQTTAKDHDCIFATNGGPFTVNKGGCIGAVISEGNVQSSGFSAGGDAMFGRTKKGEWVIGHVANKSVADSLEIEELVTGFGWLVYNGSSVVGEESVESEESAVVGEHSDGDRSYGDRTQLQGGFQAPRTVVGVDHQGRLMMLEVDGCERCKNLKGRGPDIPTMAHLFLSLGVKHGINLDGGGSSTCVMNGKVINYPTCLDIIFPRCQRRVTTVLCVKK